MTCGIICRREIDDEPWPEKCTHWDEPEPDQFERWLGLFVGVVLFFGGLACLGLLAYGVVSTIVAAV